MKNFHLFYQALSWLMQNKSLFNGENRFENLQIICKKVSEVMNSAQVGVWLLTNEKQSIVEEITYYSNKTSDLGRIYNSNNFQSYLDSLLNSRIVQYNTRSEIEKYLTNDFNKVINSLMNAPIYSDGEMVGIFLIELEDEHVWDQTEEFFFSSCADLVGRILETEKRQIYSRELNQRILFLEHNLKKRIDELDESTQDLNLALESAHAGKWTYNFLTEKLGLDENWYTQLGVSKDVIPKSFEEFLTLVHPEDRELVRTNINASRNNPSKVYEARYRLVTPQGIRWNLDRGRVTVDKNGVPVKLSGMDFDITALVHWEHDLAISEAQLKTMIESIPAPMAMFDKDIQILAYSKQWHDQWSPQYDIKSSKRKTKDRNDSRDWRSISREVIETGVSQSSDGECFQHPNEVVWLKWMISPWKNSAGVICGVIIMMEDITSKKESEMRLAQASKLSALGEMAGGIAHEINNPLSIIKGYLDLMRRHHLRGTLDKETIEMYFKKMDATVLRISRIVHGMKKFSRESSVDEKTANSIVDIINDTFDICQERIHNNGILLEYENTCESPIILCRPVEISQVLLNLINNSFYAVSDHNHPWISIKIFERDSRLVIELVDSGDGIKDSQRLFQPFYTTKQVGEGTGLGLSISRGIIEEHNGSIYYDSSRTNTTFVIELPLVSMEDIQSVQKSPSH